MLLGNHSQILRFVPYHDLDLKTMGKRGRCASVAATPASAAGGAAASAAATLRRPDGTRRALARAEPSLRAPANRGRQMTIMGGGRPWHLLVAWMPLAVPRGNRTRRPRIATSARPGRAQRRRTSSGPAGKRCSGALRCFQMAYSRVSRCPRVGGIRHSRRLSTSACGESALGCTRMRQ